MMVANSLLLHGLTVQCYRLHSSHPALAEAAEQRQNKVSIAVPIGAQRNNAELPLQLVTKHGLVNHILMEAAIRE